MDALLLQFHLDVVCHRLLDAVECRRLSYVQVMKVKRKCDVEVEGADALTRSLLKVGIT